MGQKVTFYNEISIQTPVAGGDIKVPGNSANLSSNGIYFTPANEIFQNQPPHIVQGQYIYTLGSKTITEIEENSKSIVSSQIQNNEINFTTNKDSYFVSDVQSDEFNKTITVKKSAIDLSSITTPLKNIVNSIKSTDCSVSVNDTTIRLYWDDEEGLILSDSRLQANNILIINDYNQNNTLRTDTQNIVRIFAYTELTVSLPSAYSNYLTVEDLTTNLEQGYKYGKVIKLKTKGTGWSDNYSSTYTFNGFNISAEKTDTYTSANQNNYSFKLSKKASPFTFNNSTKYNVNNNSSFDLLGITSDYITTPNYTQKSLHEVNQSYCVVNNTDKTISITNSYYVNNDTSYAEITITDNTNPTDIYHTTSKSVKLYFNGAKQWTLNLDANGGTVSNNKYTNYYYKTLTLPTPSRSASSSASYSFKGWYTASTGGSKITSLKAGGTGVTWKDYAVTLYAQWTETITSKYYWYVGQENPADLADNFDPETAKVTDNSSPGWRYIGTSKPTSSTFTSTNMLWNGDTNNISFGSRIISYIAIPYKPLQMWDVTGGDGLFYTIQNNGNPVNINGVDYYVYMSDYKTAAFTMNIYNK